MKSMRKALVGGALAGSVLLGSALGATFLNVGAGAQTTTPSTEAPAAPQDRPPRDPSVGGHVGQNGVKEELLTGDAADKAKAAALAAVPGGTVERVENDADGAVYEAHMTKADGTHVTVKLDADFGLVEVQQGHGR
ncbi:MAG: hypothetical protein QOD63_1680 [Actinomycetota bacterium]|jgi:hypothetical protein|nr:hypothetical protein [Actinomycetota bacterium]